MIKGPGIFLAQFLEDKAPFDSIENSSSWAADLGYKGLQIPTWDKRAIDFELAATSKDYCDEYVAKLKNKGLEVAELASYLQGQVLAMHPTYSGMFQPFYPEGLSILEASEWASKQLKLSVDASVNIGTKNISVLSGGFAWQMMYPWPQRPDGIVDESFNELAKRWLPVLDYAAEHGVTIGYELHPGSDLFDGATFETFLEKTNNHASACITYDPSHLHLQQLDYIDFIKRYNDRITTFHVKDAEFNPDGRMGVYGGLKNWKERAGRFRSLGDGQIDFKRIFSLLTEYGFDGWAILEWECCIKSPEQGAREGASFIKAHLIEKTEKIFDDFSTTDKSKSQNKEILGFE